MRSFCLNWLAQWRHLRRSPSDLGLLLIFPLGAIAIIAAMLIGGALRQVPVAVIDEDQSAVSRALARHVAASPTLQLVGTSASPQQVQRLLRSETVYAALHIPHGVAEGLARHTRPVLTVYYNATFLTSGKLAESAIDDAVTAALAEALPEQLNAVLPVLRRSVPVVQSTVLFNAATSFEWYLQALIHPAMLHLLVACASVVALGRLLHGGSLAAWAAGQRNLPLALAGRLAPGVLVISAWGAVWLIWLCGVRGWRPDGSLLLIWLGQLALYAATAAVSAALVAISRDVGSSLSTSAVYAGSALAYSGGTLPLIGASWFARHWSALLPFPHYLTLQMDQFLGAPPALALRGVGVLLLYTAVAGLLAWGAMRLQVRRRRRVLANANGQARAAANASGAAGTAAKEEPARA